MESSEVIGKLIFSNPLEYKYFAEVLIRLGIILGAGAGLVILYNIRNLKNTTKSITFKKLAGWAIMAPTFIISVMCGGIAALLLITFLVYRGLSEYFDIFDLPKFYFWASFGMWIFTVTAVILSMIPEFQESFGTLIYILPLIYMLTFAREK